MKMNRIQFQAGMSLSQFLADYGTESQCAAALESFRWTQGVDYHIVLTLIP